jgi:hypothetical protein
MNILLKNILSLNFLGLVALLLLIFGIYHPGLSGDYVFDDAANILDNKFLQIDRLDFEQLRAATLSGFAGPLGRPLPMLSFALNYYAASGFDAYSLKLTNVWIHIVNTALVYILALGLLPFLLGNEQRRKTIAWSALLVAALWGLHPLNLTSVLYIVQRMTSLSALFGFLAMIVYVRWRTHAYVGIKHVGMAITLLACLFLSVFSKESGMLFIPLILWVELLVFRGQVLNTPFSRPVFIGPFKLLHLVWVVVGLGVLLSLYLLPDFIRPENFVRRSFNLQERLMTEARVIFYYLRLLFLPSLSELSLYHDDFVLSKGLLTPPTTLLSIGALVFISLACAWLGWKKSAPIWGFAWGWFLIGHLMESTFISLELIHEHRNYFAIIGLCFLAPHGALNIARNLKKLPVLALAVFLCLSTFITWQRALLWSNPLDQAVFEAETHPDSTRSNYQLGRIYYNLLVSTKKPEFEEPARAALRKSTNSYMGGPTGIFGEIQLDYFVGKQPAPELFERLRRDLYSQPFYNSTIHAISHFVNCQIDQLCKTPPEIVVGLVVAALENPTADAKLRSDCYKILANYYAAMIRDYVKAEEFLRDALAESDDLGGHHMLIQTYGLQGKFDKMAIEIETMRKMDRNGAWKVMIDKEQEALEQALKARADPAQVK